MLRNLNDKGGCDKLVMSLIELVQKELVTFTRQKNTKPYLSNECVFTCRLIAPILFIQGASAMGLLLNLPNAVSSIKKVLPIDSTRCSCILKCFAA